MTTFLLLLIATLGSFGTEATYRERWKLAVAIGAVALAALVALAAFGGELADWTLWGVLAVIAAVTVFGFVLERRRTHKRCVA